MVDGEVLVVEYWWWCEKGQKVTLPTSHAVDSLNLASQAPFSTPESTVATLVTTTLIGHPHPSAVTVLLLGEVNLKEDPKLMTQSSFAPVLLTLCFLTLVS